LDMSPHEIAEAAMALPKKERLELVRRIVASINPENRIFADASQAIRGIEDVVTGKVVGLTETELRNALR
jgi:hypothetical protein